MRPLSILEYKGTSASAGAYAKAERLEEWVHIYLQSDGHNLELSDGLKLHERYFLGPFRMPLAFFSRCCGPEETMRWRIDPAWFEKYVAQLMGAIKNGADLPPLIVNFADGGFGVSDGNHRLEAYSRLNIKEHFAIVWVTRREELDEFLGKYAGYFTQAGQGSP
ncbi:MAG: ParB/RepB/Spo0J family partition protein [Clostridiaceae bacterium]|nr:ParB/RepB/Spo0J family partition protein [Eubacteriales bacterium]